MTDNDIPDGLAAALAEFDERGRDLPPIEELDLGLASPSNRPKRKRGEQYSDVTRQAIIDAIGELHLKGYKPAAIAEHFNLSMHTVTLYLSVMRQQWRRRKPEQLNSIIQKSLDSINALEREYWNAWRASQRETVTVEELSSDQLGTSTRTTTKTNSGNNTFLEGVMRCIDMRMKIVGGYAPTRVSLSWQKELEQHGADAQQLFAWLVAALTAERHSIESANVVEGSARPTESSSA